jgi:cGMP-dependent protein kinase 1
MGGCASKSNVVSSSKVPNPVSTSNGRNEESKRFHKSDSEVSRSNFKHKKLPADLRNHGADFTDAPTGLIVDRKKTQSDIKLIKSSLQRHFIFTSLDESQINLLIGHMKLCAVNSNETVFEQNSKGSAFFVISNGRVEVVVNGNRVNVMKEGDSFGELALIHDTPRSASVRTIMNTAFWVLDRRTFQSTLQELNAKSYAENKSFIESVHLFRILSEGQKEALVSCLTSLKYVAGQKIVNEGDTGDLLYIIKEGSVLCTQRSREIRRMVKGDYFGEQAMLYGSTRTATVTAVDDTVCLALNREDLITSLGDSLQDIIYKNSMRIAIDQNEVLRRLTKVQAEGLISSMQVKRYENDEVVIHAGTSRKDAILVVVKGELRGSASQKVVGKVFGVLGENDLIQETNEMYSEDLVAVGDVDVTFISASGFINSIGGEYTQVTSINEAVLLLKRVQLFKGLNADQLQVLAGMVKVQDFEDGQVIVEQNNPGDCFFLIKSGKVDIIKDDQVIRSITKHDYFGERSLLSDNTRTASVVARKKVSCWVLYKNDFLSILNENMRKQLFERIELQDDSIVLDDLNIVKLLGSGMFGNVFLTVHKQKHSLFALKTVDRRKITTYEIEENIVLERKILLQLDHVLIMKLVRTFKDSKRLYFLMEFIRGMDLFDVLRKLDLLKECDARFYIACIFVILEHLHERTIIYRDLKPENMVVDTDGYPKLIDFGTAKFVNGRTYTIVGTPHYMAPEVITSHGYGLNADYWTVGVMLYEFMFGSVPFGEDETDPYAIYEKVQERKLVFPRWADNKNKIKEFINQLLSKNPASRLGGNFDNLKSHPWFMGLKWEKILSKELKAPYIPKLAPLDIEVENALRNNKTLEEVIGKQEGKDEVPKAKRKAPPPPNWDSEF